MHRRDKQGWRTGNRRQHRKRDGETEKERRSGLTCTSQEEKTHALPHHPSVLLRRVRTPHRINGAPVGADRPLD
ncbi:hypothetical protein EYF80_035810 [Liparis tanakae]|uniref:Uncharacterized protein n=1 Tax=Liparis tanakae TaxID=230148 RepID=A0A4Z2GKK3_9TELE|nr:hypothetical protein EYF80_035810 [Liparis tanakae]